MADANKRRVSFNLAQANRIANVVKLVERTPRNTPPPPPTGPRGSGDGGGMVAVVKTTIGARSGKTAGVGTVTFQGLGEDGLYFDTHDDIPVKNPYAASIAVGKWVTLVSAPGGWTVSGSECP